MMSTPLACLKMFLFRPHPQIDCNLCHGQKNVAHIRGIQPNQLLGNSIELNSLQLKFKLVSFLSIYLSFCQTDRSEDKAKSESISSRPQYLNTKDVYNVSVARTPEVILLYS